MKMKMHEQGQEPQGQERIQGHAAHVGHETFSSLPALD
jgi:hypothetical protein